MVFRLRRMLLWSACVLAAGVPAFGQDFRVETRIVDEQAAAKRRDKGTPDSRSTLLFHAGKVYDFLDGGQVTIFEPAHERFIILHQYTRLATAITFEEIKAALFRAEKHVERFLESPLTERGSDQIERVLHIRFQLTPEFQEQYDEKTHQLSLTSRHLSYQVKCVTEQPPEAIESYLEYADWAARLSLVARRQTLLPGPRLELNKALRRRQLLPVEIVLRSDEWNKLHLRAAHRFEWKFEAIDRRTIHDWETKLTNKEFKQVPFEEFVQKTSPVEKPVQR